MCLMDKIVLATILFGLVTLLLLQLALFSFFVRIKKDLDSLLNMSDEA